MEEIFESVVICPFCGKKRTIKKVEDDGTDHLGHFRKSPHCYMVDEGCTCTLGKIAKNKVPIKKMCHNCLYLSGEICTCKGILDSMSGMFQMPSELKVNHPDKCCKYWKINLNIFNLLFKNEDFGANS